MIAAAVVLVLVYWYCHSEWRALVSPAFRSSHWTTWTAPKLEPISNAHWPRLLQTKTGPAGPITGQPKAGNSDGPGAGIPGCEDPPSHSIIRTTRLRLRLPLRAGDDALWTRPPPPPAPPAFLTGRSLVVTGPTETQRVPSIPTSYPAVVIVVYVRRPNHDLMAHGWDDCARLPIGIISFHGHCTWVSIFFP
ncbi:hypothetical protein N7462_005533 [Penicillium macrosclerotiorum]|uniref:uncharacterized protein n=1 Tax=Penicillium macrosclerotiorum TaxID=303699 RepID=UPI002547E869|nr:uncharacterized protein N7462_005533 [Penicillium macrosclerotiorum]KAJ5682368.1 hypothetical protein N7462_005533 [Penicillium macrosclerotiorum]